MTRTGTTALTLSEEIRQRFEEFSRSQKDVGQYIVDHLEEAAFHTAEELARRANTSSSTVVRFAQALGFEGFPELQAAARDEYRRARDNGAGTAELTTQPLFPIDQTEFETALGADHANMAETARKVDREEVAAAVELISHAERIVLCGYETGPCLCFPRQARFQPLKYLSALARAVEKLGGKIYSGCRVKDVQGADPDKRQPARAQIDDGPAEVLADAIVVATNTPAPINDWMGIYTKQASYRTYMIGATVPKDSVDDALYWDTSDPYHYVRLDADKARKGDTDLLLVGGEDHKTGQFPQGGAPFMALEKWAREKFPMIREVTVRWSGQVQEPDDYLAFIGRATAHAKENVFVATGDSGMGLTHGTIAAILITDLIMGRPNPWAKLYDPARKMSALNRDFIAENLNAIAQYKELVTGGEVKSVDEVPRGQGALMREGLTKVAVYRDAAGTVHKCSAICTHMGCVVQWNHVENSWDCPCHGSRFDPLGKVLMGPAIDDLGDVGKREG